VKLKVFLAKNSGAASAWIWRLTWKSAMEGEVMCFEESSVSAVGFSAVEMAAAYAWKGGIEGDWIVVDDERDGVTGVDEGVVVDHVAQLWWEVEEAEGGESRGGVGWVAGWQW
jgi:hypothetical protein